MQQTKKQRPALRTVGAVGITKNRSNDRPIKVIHTPLNYAGQASMLSQALNAAGVDSWLYYLKPSHGTDLHAYDADRTVILSDANGVADTFHIAQQINDAEPDIVHFWHRSVIYGMHGDFYNGMDIPLFRLAGARITYRFTGYELRRKSVEMALNPYSPFHYGFDFGFSEDDQKRYYDFLDPYVDAFIVQDPEMQTYCPQARIVPRLLDLTRFPVGERKPNARPVVVHAPTNDLLKGTKFVLKAVEDLKEEGLDFEFRLIKDMPNEQALELYRSSDIVVDQLLIGWYGVLGMEAMAMGKAVIAYIRDDLTGHFGGRLPLLNANPDTIKDVLRGAIKDTELRKEVGRCGRVFVEATHDGRVVIPSLKKIYEEMLQAPGLPRKADLSYQRMGGARGFLGNTERTLLTLVRRIPAADPRELERKLELLSRTPTPVDSKTATVADAERATFDSRWWGLVRKIPADTQEELERKLQLVAEAGTLDQIERKLTFDADLVSLIRRIPSATQVELRGKLELLAAGGTLAELQRKLTWDANPWALVRRIPAATPEELERKLDLLARAGTIAEVERKLGSNDRLVSLIRQIPAETPAVLERKLELLANAGTFAEVERKLGLSSADLGRLDSLRQWPAAIDRELPATAGPAAAKPEKASREPARRIFSRRPRRARTAAVAERPTRSAASLVFGSARRLLAGSHELRKWRAATAAKTADKVSVPTAFTASVAAFSSFEENLLAMLRRIPANTSEELERKIASQIAEKARAAAIARAKEHSRDFDAYLVNLARHIVANTPTELDDKLAALAAAPSSSRGSVCIVTRKPIRSVTRAPRMGKALVDAGYRVVVVAAAPPVDELVKMCPEVEYLVASNTGFVHDVIRQLQRLREQRQAREAKHQAVLAAGGWRALSRRLGRALTVPQLRRAVAWPAWQVFVILPSAYLMKKRTQRFAQLWRDLVAKDSIEIAIRYVSILNQWASTHTFAENADAVIGERQFDVVQAYDNYALVAGARLAARTGAKLVCDAVEIATDRFGDLDLSILERMCERRQRREEAGILRDADGLIGIGEALAGWYSRKYRIPPPLVVRNCRYYWPYQEDGRLRADIAAAPETRVLLWCGFIYPQQGVDLAIRALAHLPSHVHLAIVAGVLPSWQPYLNEELPALAASLGVAERIHILPAREPNDLVPYISGGDIGLVLSVPIDQANSYNSLPNKFLECVMARLPIAATAAPEVVQIIEKYDIGRVLDEHDSVKNAEMLRQMLEPETQATLKSNVMQAARELCWENESRPYVELIDSLLPEPKRGSALASRNNSPMVADAAPKPAGVIAMPAVVRGTVKPAIRPADVVAENHTVNAFLRLARYCYALADEVKADAYVTHGVEALPAAEVVAKAVGGRVYCDCVETPSFAHRSVNYNWHPTNLSLLDHAFDGYLRRTDGISTIGWALADQLGSFARPVTVIPNYRYAEELRPSDELRQKCGLGPSDVLLLAGSTICSGFEPVIEALRLLPDNVHLATLGNIVGTYRERLRSYPAEVGVANRVHFFDPVPYERLTTVASGADLGLMALDPSLTNDRLSLPNRLFDAIAAGLPIVTPDVPDIARIVNERAIGITVAANEAGSWATAINTALARKRDMRPRVLKASREMTWERLGDELHAAYGRANTVTIFGYCSLVDHQRTLRMVDTLVKRGVGVTICCPLNPQEKPEGIPGVRFVFTPPPQNPTADLALAAAN